MSPPKSEKQVAREPQMTSIGPSMLVRFYYFTCMTTAALTSLAMVLSFATKRWEIVRFDQDTVLSQVSSDSNIEVIFYPPPEGEKDPYFSVRHIRPENETNTVSLSPTTVADGSVTNLSSYVFWPAVEYGGLWINCGTIDEAVVEAEQGGPVQYTKCSSYLSISEDNLRTYPDFNLLQSLSRSAVACAIVSITTALVAIFLGTFAAVRQQIIFAMITGVCFFASAIYTFFTVTLMLLRRDEVARAPLGLPPCVLAGRHLSSSWSMYVGWVTILLCVGSGVSYTMLSIELKKTRMNYMYTSQYDQICSM